MIGEQPLSEVKAEIREAFARKGVDLETWIDEQMAKLKRAPRTDRARIESFRKVCHALRDAFVEKKSKPRRAKKVNGKKKPAA